MIKRMLVLAIALVPILAFAGCAESGGGDDLKASIVETYAAGAHASYNRSLTSAKTLDAAIDRFIAEPSQVRLDAAKRAWLLARDDYGVTEIYRFYEGPIDNETDGPEGLINAWPLDESYIDYVEGDMGAGIINKPDEFPTIDADLIISLNEEGGEENVSTGWHAIEFLLWGQDMNEYGPGYRPSRGLHGQRERRAAQAVPRCDLQRPARPPAGHGGRVGAGRQQLPLPVRLQGL